MRIVKRNMIDYEMYSEIIAEMVSELITNIGYDYNYQMVELERIENLFREYYHELKDNSEVIVSSLLETKEDYINSYKECIKQKENEIKELKEMIEEYKNNTSFKR